MDCHFLHGHCVDWLDGFIMKDMKLTEERDKSYREIRNILLKHGIRCRQSKTILGHSQNPEYNIKKGTSKNQDMIHHQLNQSILLYQDEKKTNCSENIWRRNIMVSGTIQG